MIILTILILMCMIASGTIDGSERGCFPKIRVTRNRVFLAPVMSLVKINCTVTVDGCHRSPRVSWCKLYGNDCKSLNYSNNIRTEWKSITEHEGIAFLVFLNISREDTGLYRCKEGNRSISHSLNVTVTDNEYTSHDQSNTTHNTNKEFSPLLNSTISTAVSDLNTPANDGLQWLWYFVYISSGTVVLVLIVMTLLFLYVNRQQGTRSTRKNMANKNQCMKTPKHDLLLYLNSDVLTSVVYHV